MRALSAKWSVGRAPPARASSTYRFDSRYQLSSSHKSTAERYARRLQRNCSSSETSTRRKAPSASFNIGTPDAYPSVIRVATPSRRRSAGRKVPDGRAASAPLAICTRSISAAALPAKLAAASASR